MRPDEYLELNDDSLHELDWAGKAWLRAAMDDFNTVLKNTLAARNEYEDYMRARGIVVNVEQHERRRRAHSIILGTLWALLYEMKRVGGCMLQLAQETIQYTVGFEMPEDTPAPERLRLETALRLLTERCSTLELFLEHIPKIYVRLRQFYVRVGWTIPPEDRRPPTRAWTAQ